MGNFLVAYDIASNSIRRKVSKILEGHGKQLQKSVYLLSCSHNVLKQLEEDILAIIESEDKLCVVPCCEKCLAQARITAPKIPCFMAA